MGKKKTEEDALAVAHAAEVVKSPRGDMAPWDAGIARRELEEVNRECEDIDLRGYVVGKKLNAMREAGAAALLGYATWDHFVDAEVRLSRSTAFRYMAIAEAFSEDEFKALGVSRASIVLRLPPEKRRGLLPDARLLSKRELEAEVSRQLAPPKKEEDEDAPAKGPAVVLGLLKEEGEFPITMLSHCAGYGLIKGTGSSLLVSSHLDDSGELVGEFRGIGGRP